MYHQTQIAIVLLDFILIMMTATWIIVSIYHGISKTDSWYNYTYVLLNILTLLLNLSQIKKLPMDNNE